MCLDRFVEKGEEQTEETQKASSGSFWRPGINILVILGLKLNDSKAKIVFLTPHFEILKSGIDIFGLL